jgi:glycosyltransferase involved in cell wall biosynthesis
MSEQERDMTSLGERRVVFVGLETYSLIGGIQNFNRRFIAHLGRRATVRGEAPPLVFLLRDEASDVPDLDDAEVCAIGRNRFGLIARTAAAAACEASLVVLGHVNLLPVAIATRCVAPHLPTMLIVHGDEVWGGPRYRRIHWSERLMIAAIDRVASVSAYTARRMAKGFGLPLDRFQLLPNAVDPIPTSATTDRKKAPVVLTVSRLTDRGKNVDKVIRAVAALKSEIPQICYEVVGDGALRPELQSLAAALGAANNVRFLGWASDAERDAAYMRAQVFALPSVQEGFGIVYLEAWQRGLPVICSNEGAPQEIVADGEDGCVVDAEDTSQLAARLRRLLTDPALAARMGERGRKKVSDNYLDCHFGRNVDRLIDPLIA